MESFDPYSFDLDEANALLEEAAPTELSIDVHDVGSTATSQVAEAIQPMLNEVGFDVQVFSGTPEKVPEFHRHELDALVVTAPVWAHPLQTVSRFWTSEGRWDLSGDEGDALEELVSQARSPGISAEEEEEIYTDIGMEMSRLALINPICTAKQRMLAQRNIVGLTVGGMDRLNMRYVAVAE